MGKQQRDQSVYTLIGYFVLAAIVLLMGAILVALAHEGVIHHVSDQFVVKWGGLVLNTLALFGWIVKQCRAFWHSKVFWYTIVGLLIVHSVCFWVILRNVQEWRIVWFLAMYPVEVPLIARVLDWSKDQFGDGRSKRRVLGI
jgi:cytochrome bd-type quinol oxidase subunit 2